MAHKAITVLAMKSSLMPRRLLVLSFVGFTYLVEHLEKKIRVDMKAAETPHRRPIIMTRVALTSK